ncbi:hypothetical protein CI102_11681 [Trichoderma harzianum]|uniref:Uncharacterized protein n=1 Tax=Trichoderma harzianum CBS 226.95 TaxID=983964 RepID=A0A2T4ATT3_TRIHA|nr:hypothetical protein M431DRAFT_182855 [Trichoderma harzianum CBS 226.95]PKK45277.1 hypothetical protein CI102_11681 [Trichoderma harzianum]PTB60477.1 hypothetical protein M431DRAFT_182855 [Trichoderma harzianum CBS 226.95]
MQIDSSGWRRGAAQDAKENVAREVCRRVEAARAAKKVQGEGEGEDEEGSEDEVDDASKLAQSLAVWAGLVRQRHGRRCSSHIFSSVRGLAFGAFWGLFWGVGAAVAAGKGGERRRLLEGKGFYSREYVLRREWRIQVNSTGTLLGEEKSSWVEWGRFFGPASREAFSHWRWGWCASLHWTKWGGDGLFWRVGGLN